jgi:hypothetical protein
MPMNNVYSYMKSNPGNTESHFSLLHVHGFDTFQNLEIFTERVLSENN